MKSATNGSVEEVMISRNYRLEEFISAVLDKSMPQIQALLITEQRDARSPMHRGRAKAASQADYVEKLGQLLFFLGQGMKPSGVYDDEWRLYRRLTEALVKRGELKPEVMTLFETPAPVTPKATNKRRTKPSK